MNGTKQQVLLKVLNNIMLIATGLIDQILNYDIEISDKDIDNAEQACRLLANLQILREPLF